MTRWKEPPRPSQPHQTRIGSCFKKPGRVANRRQAAGRRWGENLCPAGIAYARMYQANTAVAQTSKEAAGVGVLHSARVVLASMHSPSHIYQPRRGAKVSPLCQIIPRRPIHAPFRINVCPIRFDLLFSRYSPATRPLPPPVGFAHEAVPPWSLSADVSWFASSCWPQLPLPHRS
jgi:hypothetical protein